MTDSPRMLALVTDAFGGRGGIAQYNRDFLNALVRTQSVASITVVPRNAPDRAEPPLGVVQTGAWSGRLVYSIAALIAAMRDRVDVVFCGHLYLAPLAALIARLKSAKLIVQTHGVEAWPRPSRARRAALEAADLVLCVSRHTRAAVLDWAMIQPERVIVLPNTVRDIFTPGEGSSAAVRVARAIENKRVLLSVGSMDSNFRYKGQDRVIEAIPELVAKGHDICYLIAGEGDDQDRLKQLASDRGVSERVRFLGPIGLEELADVYRMADLFVMPSTGEGFGIVFLEAMASGTPALGLGVAGARDALGEGQLGTMVSEVGLAGAIGRALDAPKPDPRRLAAAVRSRFGGEAFSGSSRAAIGRLMEIAGA